MAEILWAITGLVLTVGGTFLEAQGTGSVFGQVLQPLHVSYQVGAVLLTGCLGGKNAALSAQVAYILLGLVGPHWFGLQVFGQGGGLNYVHQPGFGYLLGFLPGAWLCGEWAFRFYLRLETLAFSCLVGLVAIQGVGILYLVLGTLTTWVRLPSGSASLLSTLYNYSLVPLPGQIGTLCAVVILSYGFRLLLAYF